MTEQYRVLKDFMVQEVDEHEMMVENSEITIPVGSLWEVREECENGMIKLDRIDKCGWLEIDRLDLEDKEYFEMLRDWI